MSSTVSLKLKNCERVIQHTVWQIAFLKARKKAIEKVRPYTVNEYLAEEREIDSELESKQYSYENFQLDLARIKKELAALE